MEKFPGHGVCTADRRARPAGPAIDYASACSRSDSRDYTLSFSFTKIDHWSVLVKEMGPKGVHEGDPTENGCFTEGKRAAARMFFISLW